MVLDEAKSKAVKTGELAKQFGKLGLQSVLIVDGTFDKNFELSARNLSHVACCRLRDSTSTTSSDATSWC